MRRTVLFAVLLAVSARAENLLTNPGFEMVSNGAPVDWSVFVEPKQGATSFLDQRVSKDGSNSAKLSIEIPYINDPANNWSQNVIADVRGKRLRLKGYIKTENATEAALWLQCYAKDPLKLALQESTSSKGLVTGTNDWTLVELSVDAPLETDFVVVRCVLRFRGTAWFDAVSLDVEAPAATQTATDAAPTRMPTPPSMPKIPDIAAPPSTPGPAQTTPADAQEILKAHEELRKTNWQLRQTNQSMTRQIDELRKQIEELKKQVLETSAAAKQLKEQQSKPAGAEKSAVTPPPLVPDEAAHP